MVYVSVDPLGSDDTLRVDRFVRNASRGDLVVVLLQTLSCVLNSVQLPICFYVERPTLHSRLRTRGMDRRTRRESVVRRETLELGLDGLWITEGTIAGIVLREKAQTTNPTDEWPSKCLINPSLSDSRGTPAHRHQSGVDHGRCSPYS